MARSVFSPWFFNSFRFSYFCHQFYQGLVSPRFPPKGWKLLCPLPVSPPVITYSGIRGQLRTSLEVFLSTFQITIRIHTARPWLQWNKKLNRWFVTFRNRNVRIVWFLIPNSAVKIYPKNYDKNEKYEGTVHNFISFRRLLLKCLIFGAVGAVSNFEFFNNFTLAIVSENVPSSVFLILAYIISHIIEIPDFPGLPNIKT